MREITQLGYLGISVSDAKAWEDLAQSVLGMQVEERTREGTIYLRMDEYHHRVALHPDGQDEVAYIGWQVADEQALETVRARLEAAGVKVKAGTSSDLESRKVAALYKFEDPDGHPLEIACGQLVSERPFVPGRPISGFKTGPLGMGHVVLRSSDLKKSIAFYRDVLGLSITDYIDASEQFQVAPGQGLLVFFHCNPRHHSLALGALPMPKRIHHFMVEVQSAEDVLQAYELCQERGGALMTTIGKHTNDHMISFYLRNPSGFGIEYGWNGRLVGGPEWVVQLHRRTSIWGHKPVGGGPLV